MKYTLPEGIAAKEPLPRFYNKSTKLTFIDPIYGEFISTVDALQYANASMHPIPKKERHKNRLKNSMLKIHGVSNPSQIEDMVEKRINNIKDLNKTVKNPEINAKRKATMIKRFGVDHPMKSLDLKNKQKNSSMEIYGTDNPAKNKDVQLRTQQTNIKRYGVSNPSKSPLVIEKILKTRSENLELGISNEEKEVLEYIQSLGIQAEKGYFGGSAPCEIDIKIKDLKIAIEYNGLHWHSIADRNTRIDNKYHYNKTLLAEKNDYRLIHIFSHEWENRKFQVKSFLTSALNKNERYIYARKCNLLPVDKQIANEFLNSYHILGKTNFSEAFGLYYEGELVNLITIGKHHRPNNNEWILSRYVGKYNVTVVGGLSKLTKHAINKYETIATWIDRRWSNGKSWEKLGWTVVSELFPDYFYYNPNKHCVISKQSRKKSVVKTPQGMTETQHAKLDGLEKVYDCGKIKLIIGKH